MINDLITRDDYKDLTTKQIKEVLHYIQDKNISFNLTCNIEGIDFNPEIPESIYKNFTPYTLFTLANYTLESLAIQDENISFEAGFGAENFGSVCFIPYYAIFQISIEESILFINPSATVERNFEKSLEESEQKKKSMNAFNLS